MTALAAIREVPGLEDYLDELEERLQDTVGSHPGTVAAVGADALAAGGKRLRPMLVFLSSPAEGPPPLAAGVAVELIHMATLVHDDLIDGARYRRGRAAAWAAYGAPAARAAGDYLFARAFAGLAETGDAAAVELLADATLCLARGEAMQRRQTHDPDTTVESYFARCALKTGTLFEAACLLGSGGRHLWLGEFGTALGIAFQITDDILDCTGEATETGKIAGVDLREGTPTCRCSSLRARIAPYTKRWRAARSTVHSFASPRQARSLARARLPSTTLTVRGRDSKATRTARSSKP